MANPNLAKALSEHRGHVSTLHTGRSSFDLNSRVVLREREEGREREREAEGKENEASFAGKGRGGAAYKAAGAKEKRAEGRRAGNYVSGRPFVRLQSSLHNTGLGRSWLAPSQGKEEKSGRSSEEETRERRGEEKETSGRRERKRIPGGES